MQKQFFSFGYYGHIARKDGSKIDHKEILRGVLSKLFKNDSGKIVELLDNEETTTEELTSAILQADQTRISNLNKGKTFQDGYKKAKAEERAAFEAEIKSKYGIEEGEEGHELTGQELIDHIVQAKAQEQAAAGSGKDAKTLTIDEIKALPNYQKIEKEWKQTLKKSEDDWKEKYQNLETSQQQAATFSEFASEALKELNSLNPVIPGKANVAANRQKLFLDSFKQYEIRKNDDGSFTFLQDGKVIDDGHGNSLDWKELVKTTASEHYEFQENNGGGNAGNSNDKNKGGSSTGNAGGKIAYPEGYSRPKTAEEYAKVVSDRTIDFKVRQQYSQAYNAENSATGE